MKCNSLSHAHKIQQCLHLHSYIHSFTSHSHFLSLCVGVKCCECCEHTHTNATAVTKGRIEHWDLWGNRININYQKYNIIHGKKSVQQNRFFVGFNKTDSRTPIFAAALRSTWLVPMQKQPIQSSDFASLIMDSVICVRLLSHSNPTHNIVRSEENKKNIKC
jgi:hypothetical protein